jgi:hypothetical protein
MRPTPGQAPVMPPPSRTRTCAAPAHAGTPTRTCAPGASPQAPAPRRLAGPPPTHHARRFMAARRGRVRRGVVGAAGAALLLAETRLAEAHLPMTRMSRLMPGPGLQSPACRPTARVSACASYATQSHTSTCGRCGSVWTHTCGHGKGHAATGRVMRAREGSSAQQYPLYPLSTTLSTPSQPAAGADQSRHIHAANASRGIPCGVSRASRAGSGRLAD